MADSSEKKPKDEVRLDDLVARIESLEKKVAYLAEHALSRHPTRGCPATGIQFPDDV